MKKITSLLLFLTICYTVSSQSDCSLSIESSTHDTGLGELRIVEVADNFVFPDSSNVFEISDYSFTILGIVGLDLEGLGDMVIRFYEDNNGLPGELIAESEDTPLSINFIEVFNDAINVSSVDVNLSTPLELTNEDGEDTQFWYSIFAANGVDLIILETTDETDDTVSIAFKDGDNPNDPWSNTDTNGNLRLPGIVATINGNCTTLSIADNILTENISLYPNPTNGENITLEFASNFGQADINITTLTGQTALSTTVSGFGSNTINTSELSSGLYFAQVKTDNANTVIKFVVN